MSTSKPADLNVPTVSVIITCYNHARFLSKAIQSVVDQSYPLIEIVVVDDGSIDNTKEVAQKFPEVNYVYQSNQGLSGARNTGIARSTGAFLIFLDADDWLLPEGVAINLKYFNTPEKIGLVSGNYMRFYEETSALKIRDRVVKDDAYAELLLSNHLRMHGAVMFPRFVFERFQYDTSLRSGEDWDMTLHVSRHYPVVQHSEPVAVYRKYGNSMSSNSVVMLETGLAVLEKQRAFVRTPKEANNLNAGCKTLKQKFCRKIYQQILVKGDNNGTGVQVLFRYNTTLFLKYHLKRLKHKLVSQ